MACISTKSKANVDEEAESLERMRQEIAELKELIKKKRAKMEAGDDLEGEGEGDSDDDVDASDLEELLEMKLNGMLDDDDIEEQRRRKVEMQ